MKRLTLVVPFLNEEHNLPAFYDRATRALAGEPEEVEFLFVDDGSDDGSADWVRAKAQADPRVRLLRLSRNFGHQIAITAGLDHADGDAAVILDADLQDPPELLPRLLEKWRAGAEIVHAVRRDRQGETWLKKRLAAAFYRVFRAVSSVNTPANAGEFRLVDRKVVRALRRMRERRRFVRGLTCWAGFRQESIEFDRPARFRGNTKYPTRKSWNLAMDALLSFSGAPLRGITGAGLAMGLGGVLWAGASAARAIFQPDRHPWGLAGWSGVFLALSGIHLLCLGIVGQYVLRIHEECLRRPLYLLRD